MSNAHINSGGESFNWLIPPDIVAKSWNLEDIYNSNDHHYGVRQSHYCQIQDTKVQERQTSVYLSRRLRKVLALSAKTKEAMELQDNRAPADKLFELLRDSYI